MMNAREKSQKNLKHSGNEEIHKRKQGSKYTCGKASVQYASGGASQHQASAREQAIHQASKLARKQESKKIAYLCTKKISTYSYLPPLNCRSSRDIFPYEKENGLAVLLL